jgi:hypothetical protein
MATNAPSGSRVSGDSLHVRVRYRADDMLNSVAVATRLCTLASAPTPVPPARSDDEGDAVVNFRLPAAVRAAAVSRVGCCSSASVRGSNSSGAGYTGST